MNLPSAKKESPLILEGQALESARYESGHAIPTYDDGFGTLWIARNSMGIDGIIRASTFEDAYGIWEDEFAGEADFATWEDIATDCDVSDPETLMDDAIFQENFGFRPNGANMKDKHGHGIYQKDLNGEYLEPLTSALVKEIGIILKISPVVESWTVWSVDCWGNAEDGWEFNDRCKVGTIELMPDLSNDEIGEALEDAGYLKPGSTAHMEIEDHENAMYINGDDGCQWLQLEKGD